MPVNYVLLVRAIVDVINNGDKSKKPVQHYTTYCLTDWHLYKKKRKYDKKKVHIENFTLRFTQRLI